MPHLSAEKQKDAVRRAQSGTIQNALRLSGCGSQHPPRALSGTCVLLAAAPTTPPCFRRWRRSSSLHSGHFKRNFIIICDSGKSAELVGAKLLHLLTQTALPLKSPTGAFIAAHTRIFPNRLFTGRVVKAVSICFLSR